jgi:hypothetical protein
MEYPVIGLNKKTDKYVDTYDVIRDKGEAETIRDLLNEDKNENHLRWEVRESRTCKEDVLNY